VYHAPHQESRYIKYQDRPEKGADPEKPARIQIGREFKQERAAQLHAYVHQCKRHQ
jgi:hypothetical protein